MARLQVLAAGGLIASYVSALAHFPDFLTAGMLLVSCAIFAYAFLLWVWPLAKAFWGNAAGKLVLAVLNLMVLWAATVFARSVVAGAVGLPPQFLDLTVKFFVLVFYIPAALLFTCFVLAVTVALLEIIAMAKEHLFWKYLGLMIGALVLSVACATIWTLIAQSEQRFYPLARQVAYFADFEPASSYPGVEREARIVLLDGGWVAVAAGTIAEPRFTVRKLIDE